MAKIQTGISIDELIYRQAKALADEQRRNFSVTVEIALEQYIQQERERLALPLKSPKAQELKVAV